MNRCPWCGNDELYIKYHDEEWGAPVHDDTTHFEFLVLESAQAGLSWLTVLRKRENYRNAYDHFDPITVAGYDGRKIKDLIQDNRIIRNRRKIEASVNNARRFLEIQKEFGSFDTYLWKFVDNAPIVNSWNNVSEIPPKSPVSDEIARDLKKRGFQFVGSTIIYSHMQAVGLVNDHIVSCFRYRELMCKRQGESDLT
jgi:DNA-3-methyladenine glycosylase I